MLWQIDQRDPQPLYEQIANVVRRAVDERTLRPGDRLPTGKDLAGSLDVNLHTVLRAYQTLRDEGLIELRRGRGAVVIASGNGAARLSGMVVELVAQADRLGISRHELIQMIDKEAQE